MVRAPWGSWMPIDSRKEAVSSRGATLLCMFRGVLTLAPIALPATMGDGVDPAERELLGLDICVSLVMLYSGRSAKISAMVAKLSVT